MVCSYAKSSNCAANDILVVRKWNSLFSSYVKMEDRFAHIKYKLSDRMIKQL